jgi:hypothetical protein
MAKDDKKLVRKRQHSKSKKGFDPTEAVGVGALNLSLIGTEGDCFGKIHDPTDNECKMCGDAGLCMIIQGQTNRLARKVVEDKHEFRDLPPKKLVVKKKVLIKKKKK